MTTKKTTTRQTTSKKPAAKRTAKTPSTKRPTKKASKPRAAKETKKASTKTAPSKRKPGALDSAARVLAETKQPMSAREMIDVMAAKGLWKSPDGATPSATLYSAIIREIATKGKDARFTKVQRGRFASAKRGS
jgi:hypothetical protein